MLYQNIYAGSYSVDNYDHRANAFYAVLSLSKIGYIKIKDMISDLEGLIKTKFDRFLVYFTIKIKF